ncbi:hypothetical protein L1987_44708 [Smallanthus sonchifolius]|uniref:Uncharacterized protein n=1 Tax=Smallanthus sonchifolius TaxID=185202 RepID=A0ACB9GQV3_9ASTR|nr:hypothetical protein L1987_44708 [Smallanthus sonchifolius]
MKEDDGVFETKVVLDSPLNGEGVLVSEISVSSWMLRWKGEGEAVDTEDVTRREGEKSITTKKGRRRIASVMRISLSSRTLRWKGEGGEAVDTEDMTRREGEKSITTEKRMRRMGRRGSEGKRSRAGRYDIAHAEDAMQMVLFETLINALIRRRYWTFSAKEIQDRKES